LKLYRRYLYTVTEKEENRQIGIIIMFSDVLAASILRLRAFRYDWDGKKYSKSPGKLAFFSFVFTFPREAHDIRVMIPN
jgi:hypothetical protein